MWSKKSTCDHFNAERRFPLNYLNACTIWIIEHFKTEECYFVENRPNKKLKSSGNLKSGNSEGLQSKSSENVKTGNSKALQSKSSENLKSGNSEALQSKSSKNKKKRGHSEAVGSKLKKSKNTWKQREKSTEGLENLSWK